MGLACALTGCLMACAPETPAPSASTTSASSSINVITREQGSGTRSAFIELTGILEKEGDKKVDKTYAEAAVQSSTDAVMTAVAKDEASIGYISLGSLNDTVKALKIDDVEATPDHIKDGSYKLSRPFNVAYKKDLPATAQDFLDFIMSEDGQKIVDSQGYISEKPTGAYQAKGNTGHITIAGSTSVTPLMEKLVEAYKQKNPEISIDIQSNGSSAGMNAAMEGSADLGMASRELKAKEKDALACTVIAKDGIAVIVNKNNPIDSMTLAQLKDVFTGTITTYSDISK